MSRPPQRRAFGQGRRSTSPSGVGTARRGAPAPVSARALASDVDVDASTDTDRDTDRDPDGGDTPTRTPARPPCAPPTSPRMTISLPVHTARAARPHPYLAGNFAPVAAELPLTPCTYVGAIPPELAGGEYVRNGGNPLSYPAPGAADDGAHTPQRHYHWFDGDGMLAGVYFRRQTPATKIAPTAESGDGDDAVQPEFVNAHVLTDVYLHARHTPALRAPLLPSIALLADPLAPAVRVGLAIVRALLLVLVSHLPGARTAVKKLSVANTAVAYHDGRALATCESGPPMQVVLPGLQSAGWFEGGEGALEFGKGEALGWMKKWTTGHPRVDSFTNEMILYHAIPLSPYIEYSIIQPTLPPNASSSPNPRPSLRNVAVPGLSGPKLSHDFAITRTHTLILDLPLHLDTSAPFAPLRPGPALRFDPGGHARFGVFPRYAPARVRWFEDVPGGACCVFHTVAAWDERPAPAAGGPADGDIDAVGLLACRLNSAALIYNAGALAAPADALASRLGTRGGAPEPERCELYFWRFALRAGAERITHRFALCAIPFEFPCVPGAGGVDGDGRGGPPRFVYGCTMRHGCFDAGLGRAAKIDALAKVDAARLVAEGARRGLEGGARVDERSVQEILADQARRTRGSGRSEEDEDADAIRIFALPAGWYAQEPAFVARRGGTRADDGWLLTYVFDEAQLGADGAAGAGAHSELWVVDARGMADVVARVRLPQRVPYGLHGRFFDEREIEGQRPVASIRTLRNKLTEDLEALGEDAFAGGGLWDAVRRWGEHMLG